MDRCDFSSIMTCLKNHISESNQMSQPEFLYEIFEDFMDSPESKDFSFDNGLVCQCCGMPLEDDSIIGRDSDGSLNEDYCKWCYADGTYTYSDMDELIDVCVRNMVSENFTEEQARSYMKELLPNWFSIKKGKLP